MDVNVWSEGALMWSGDVQVWSEGIACVYIRDEERICVWNEGVWVYDGGI